MRSDFSFCEGLGAKAVPADLTDAKAVAKAVKGVDIINAPYGPQLNRVYVVK